MAGQRSIGRKEWDAVAEAYSGTTENIPTQFAAPLLDAVHAAAGDDLLDVACGTRAAAVIVKQVSSCQLDAFRRRLAASTSGWTQPVK